MTKPRIEELVDQMTLEEQVSILAGEDFWSTPAVERLGIQKMRVTDGPNGARGGGSLFGGVKAAAFPVGISLGSTWDVELAEQVGAAIAQEVKSKSAHVLLAPTVNMHRSVTNGRNFECYSEDPELSAAIGVGYITGVQSQGVSATMKHYIGNESEIERTTINSEISERALREVYLRPFEDAVKKAKTWGIMSSYNKLNGTYTAENAYVLTKVLREDWNYDGIVMSDWFGSRATVEPINAGLDLEMPGPSRDRGEKLVQAVESGDVSRETVRGAALNMLRLMERVGSLWDDTPFEEHANDLPEHRALIRKAGAAGTVLLKNEGILPLSGQEKSIALIGPNAKDAKIMGGGSAQLNPHYMVSPYDAFVERLGANAVSVARGCTNHRWEPLLKGDYEADFYDNLTFSGDPVATQEMKELNAFWVQPICGGKVQPQNFSVRIRGTYRAEHTGVHHIGVHAAGYYQVFVDGEMVIDASEGKWEKGRTFFEEGNDELVAPVDLTAGQDHSIVIEYKAKKPDNLEHGAIRAGLSVPLGDADIAEAAEMAAGADAAIVFVGRSGEWDTEGSDLQDIKLPGRQDELVAAVLAANPNAVIVLQTGGPVEMPWIDDARAVLQAWYPGQECGNAIADVIFGDVDPGGRLPQTFPKRIEDNPAWSDDPEVYPGQNGKVRYAEGVMVGYRHYDQAEIAPLFPFGFGLSYTSFTLSDLECITADDGTVVVRCRVENTGARTGSTVVQIYVSDPEASVERPLRELKAFRKLELAAGEAQDIELTLDSRAFAYFDEAAADWRVEAGVFVIAAGFNVTDLPLSQTVTLDERRIPV